MGSTVVCIGSLGGKTRVCVVPIFNVGPTVLSGNIGSMLEKISGNISAGPVVIDTGIVINEAVVPKSGKSESLAAVVHMYISSGILCGLGEVNKSK